MSGTEDLRHPPPPVRSLVWIELPLQVANYPATGRTAYDRAENMSATDTGDSSVLRDLMCRSIL